MQRDCYGMVEMGGMDGFFGDMVSKWWMLFDEMDLGKYGISDNVFLFVGGYFRNGLLRGFSLLNLHSNSISKK